MCDLLDELGVDNRLCHPLKTKAIASARIKTDKIDSGILAQLGRMDFVPEAYKADIETRLYGGLEAAVPSSRMWDCALH